MLIALRGLVGCGEAIVQPTLSGLTPAMVRRDDLPRASAVNQTANISGLLTGPAIAGVLVGGYGLRVPLLLTAASLLGATVVSIAAVIAAIGAMSGGRRAARAASGPLGAPGARSRAPASRTRQPAPVDRGRAEGAAIAEACW